MQEYSQITTVKAIKKAFLAAFDYLGNKDQQEKNKVLRAIKSYQFYQDWLVEAG